MTTVDVRLKLSDEVLEYLQRESENRQVPLDNVVSDVLADYFEEPTKAEILTGIRQSMLDVLAGNVRPADAVLAELKQDRTYAVDRPDSGLKPTVQAQFLTQLRNFYKN